LFSRGREMEGLVRFLKYSLAGLGLFLGALCLLEAAAKILFPSLVGVWIGPHAGFVMGVANPDPTNVELLGDAFAPLFGMTGYLLASFSWNRMRTLRMTRPAPIGRHQTLAGA